MKRSHINFRYAVRRTQKNQEKIKNDTLINKLGQPDFFKELKKDSKSGDSLFTVIDDHHGTSEIANHFKGLYEKLYNEQVNDNLNDIAGKIKDGINENTQS